RPAPERGDATVGCAPVARKLVTDRDLRLCAGGERERRVEGCTVQIDEAAEAVRVLVDAVETEGHLVAEWLAEVARDAPVVEGAAGQSYLARTREVGLFGHAVDDAA